MNAYEFYIAHLRGNSKKYAPENVEVLPPNALCGKRILFLGSSVTYGAASGGTSFVEYIAKRNNCVCTKEAVSGTTLADLDEQSYVSRLHSIEDDTFDIFVCQLSTNDATQNVQLDKVRNAILEITVYAKSKFACPILFFTNPYYKSTAYAKMVDLAHTLSHQAEFALLDLYNDAAFNSITARQRKLYMADKIHPTKAGYLLWLTPKFEQSLKSLVQQA